MSASTKYRSRIYPYYASLYNPHAADLGDGQLNQNADAIQARLGFWLPEERGVSCLDVACGTGNLLFLLKRCEYKRIEGVDCSEQQLEIAAKVGVTVHHADAVAFLKDQVGQYDLITGLDIIEHFTKDELFEFLDNVFQALKPGGRVIFQTPNADSPWSGALRYGDITHELALTPGSLQTVLSAAGFQDYEARECKPFVHGLKSSVRAIGWRMVRQIFKAWSLVETGTAGSNIYTRVFVAKAVKPL